MSDCADILEIEPDLLDAYGTIPIAFTVESVLQVDEVESGLGGFRLAEKSVEPYVKDYDAVDEPGQRGRARGRRPRARAIHRYRAP